MNSENFVSMIERLIGGIALESLAAGFGIFLLTLIARKVFDRYLSRFLAKITSRTRTEYDDLLLQAISHPISAIILTVGGYYSVMVLNLPTEPYNFPKFFTVAFKVAVSLLVIWTVYRLSNLLAQFLMSAFSRMDEEMARQFAPLVTQAVKITIVIIGILVVIQNLGYSIGSVLAGLGIGGLAVALAAQDTLANLFGTFVMLMDRPFKVGDWVQFNDIDGDVESIGFRSTKVRTWSKSLKIVPNKLLTSEIIENWSKMPKRRVKMTLGITYSATSEQVMALREEFESILRDDPGVDQEYYLVYFTGFGSSALEFFVYYFTKSTVWKEYLEVRQRVNMKFMDAVGDQGLSFAFPSQTLYFGNSELRDPRITSLTDDLPD